MKQKRLLSTEEFNKEWDKVQRNGDRAWKALCFVGILWVVWILFKLAVEILKTSLHT